MKKTLLAGVAVLLLGTGAVHATEDFCAVVLNLRKVKHKRTSHAFLVSVSDDLAACSRLTGIRVTDRRVRTVNRHSSLGFASRSSPNRANRRRSSPYR